MPGETGATRRTRVRSITTIAHAACGRIERPAFPAPSFQREPDQRANLAQKHAARSRTYAQCAPLPPRALARGGEGVGGSRLASLAASMLKPPPPPPPPRRFAEGGGRLRSQSQTV